MKRACGQLVFDILDQGGTQLGHIQMGVALLKKEKSF